MPSFHSRQKSQDALLVRHLQAFFGALEPAAMELLRHSLKWLEISGGDTLLTQGEAGDAMYLVVSGRLRAFVQAEGGGPQRVGDIVRGQVVGEMSLYTGEPRAATVVAVRDAVLARLDRPAFQRLLACSTQVSMAFTTQIIHKLKDRKQATPADKLVTMGLLPITTGIDLPDFAARLATQLKPLGRVCVVSRHDIDQRLEQLGLGPSDNTDKETQRRIAMLLDQIEAEHDFVLLLADATPTPWTQRCCRHCDELLLLADATQPPVLHPSEVQFLSNRPPLTVIADILVLLHPADQPSPRGTALWLARRPVAGHIHIRPDLSRDMARLARIQSRTAVGLVLAGGGARGLAHLGVLRALHERGIEVDWVGGTSIGAVMATYAASDQPLDTVMANARRAFATNPTGDFNLFPVLSLIKGLRLKRILRTAVEELVGFDADIEDLWKNFFCVATNFSTASEQRLQHGNLAHALLASTSIPGALPPVAHGGDLLCDGGSFNNFPVDVVRSMRGVGRVIGVDLNVRTPVRVDFDDMPGSWALLRDRLRPLAQRRYRLPSLPSYLQTVTILYSMSRQHSAQQQCDLYFNPPLHRVGMLQWRRLENIVQRGYAHALQVLDAPPDIPSP
ncbi:patatin-like phospholipase family protein [Rhodoferax sp.]|uniref:patatin-like phospholipase family protein n=1 Tax=Rhodoferax sp. TaxID=50421 RepID=UPI0025EA24AA|nr:patatin-like phospholipase family protein [Rhodoferax sp.]